MLLACQCIFFAGSLAAHVEARSYQDNGGFSFRKLCTFLLGSVGALVSLGMQAMKKADAEEAPAMKSMKAMKACSGMQSLKV